MQMPGTRQHRVSRSRAHAALRVSLVLMTFILAACSPSLAPLYRDYEVEPAGLPESTLYENIEAALEESAWELAPASAPNVIATESRQINNWGLYKVIVSLEVVPVGGDYVRVYIHPYRKFFTGSRSKIPFLRAKLRRSVLTDLNAALEAQGLHVIGTAIQRDRLAERR